MANLIIFDMLGASETSQDGYGEIKNRRMRGVEEVQRHTRNWPL